MPVRPVRQRQRLHTHDPRHAHGFLAAQTGGVPREALLGDFEELRGFLLESKRERGDGLVQPRHRPRVPLRLSRHLLLGGVQLEDQAGELIVPRARRGVHVCRLHPLREAFRLEPEPRHLLGGFFLRPRRPRERRLRLPGERVDGFAIRPGARFGGAELQLELLAPGPLLAQFRDGRVPRAPRRVELSLEPPGLRGGRLGVRLGGVHPAMHPLHVAFGSLGDGLGLGGDRRGSHRDAVAFAFPRGDASFVLGGPSKRGVALRGHLA